MAKKPSLTKREQVVLDWIGGGLETAEIAEKMKVATSTIQTYRERLKKKLGVSTGTALLRYAMRESILRELGLVPETTLNT